MFNKVDTSLDKVNVVDLEHKISKFWEENDSFNKLRELNKDGKPWSFLDGPITANNSMGVHHAWGRTLKDVYQRYHAMLGESLRYQNGFDCQGLWVEVEVEKELGFHCKKDIEEYGVEKFVNKCKERVVKYSKIQTEQSKRLGYWMDWDNSYYTMSDENNFTIWSFLKKCHDRGFVYKGKDVMPWCPRCGTGVSQHEMHEGYKDVSHTSVIVKFPIKGRDNEFLLAWTTTPWTLTSNVAAAVNTSLDYVKVEQDGHTYYLAKALTEKVLGKKESFKVIETIKGSELVGLTYTGPFDELEAQMEAKDQHRVIGWDDVSESDGTGIVHIAPGCGAEDFRLGKQENLAALCPIDEGGLFTKEFAPYTGKHAYDMAPEIIASLKEKGVFYSDESFFHSYPHCWRCQSELLFRLVDEWFISMDEWRQEIMEVVKQIEWIPAYGKELELDWLKNMRDWMISKKRYWGLALPIWTCSDEECDWFDVVGSKAELTERATAGMEGLKDKSPHKPQIDEVTMKCGKCGKTANRVKDVGNPWLDAGIVPYSTMSYNTDRPFWEKWFPAELVLECFPGQFRNWFYALLAMSTMMENKPPFKTLLGHALVRDENGLEMHKSTGTAIWFDDAVEKIGADVMRWLYCNQDPTVNLNFGYGIAREIRGKFYNTLWQVYAYFSNYARLAGFKPDKDPVPFDERPDMDKWILSHMTLLLKQAPKAFEKYEVQKHVRNVASFVEKLSNWYIRQNRRRFWKNLEEGDSRIAFDTLYRCLSTMVKVIAPVMPFTAEEMYQNLERSHDMDAPESVHHCRFPEADDSWLDEQLVKDMDGLRRITGLALSAREIGSLKVRQPLSELIIQPGTEDERTGSIRFEELLKDILNVKSVNVIAEGETLPVTYEVKPQFRQLGPLFGKQANAAANEIRNAKAEDVLAAIANDTTFDIVLDGETHSLSKDCAVVESSTADHLAVANDLATTVAVNKTITPDLACEGLMRDTLRNLQNMRKETGLEIEDRVEVIWYSESKDFAEMIQKYEEHIKEELLCLKWTVAKVESELKNPLKLEINDQVATVELVKTKN
jgi:isoleucyl-tRNA synthetase